MAATGKSKKSFCFLQTHFVVLLLFYVALHATNGVNADDDDAANAWKKKDVRDYTDADLERLLEQWEEDDDPLEDDELPEWKRPQPKIDLSKINPNDPESMLHQTKKGRTLMMFATVSGDPKESETEEITKIWQGSLFNAHYDFQRYIVASNRVLFVLKDGSKAWEIKNFLIQQDRCEVVTIEGKDHYGKGSPNYQPPPSVDNRTRRDPSSKPQKKIKNSHNDIKDTKIEL